MQLFRTAIGSAVVSAIFLLGSTSAQAMSMTWTFHDAYFHDRGSLSGSFDFDADSNTFSNINLTTTPGRRHDGATYSSVVEVLSTPLSIAATSAGNYIGVILSAPMTNNGGSIGVMPVLSTEGVMKKFFGKTIPLPKRFLVKGKLVADTVSLPEPATLALFSVGLLGIFSLRRRKQP
ncbi:MAG: PEP-CTERM sorting domain-containing protein [Gammaproteobacteria bacterium]